MNGTELKRFRLGLGYDRHNILQKLPVICFVVKREALFRLDT